MVIDTDDGCRGEVGEILTRLGLDVIEAVSTNEALEAVCHARPHIVVIDADIPEAPRSAEYGSGRRGGVETVRRIRSANDCLIMALSVHAEESDVVEGLDAGADDYVAKPFFRGVFQARVEALLRRPGIGTGLPAGGRHRKKMWPATAM
ncbi:MAG TPA: response regulator, partial [Microbacteriaceae bacterium]|nr:response regulator [Microbacteriaceae bacterium]